MNDLKMLNIDQLEAGDKITLVKQSDFGFPIAIKLKVDKAFYKDYAQYRDCVQIQGKPPRKRKLRAYLVRPNEDFRIYEGFVDVLDTSEVISEDSEVTVRCLGTCFDENSLKKASPNGKVLYGTY